MDIDGEPDASRERFERQWAQLETLQRHLAEKIYMLVHYAGGRKKASQATGIKENTLDNYRSGKSEPKFFDLCRLTVAAGHGHDMRYLLAMTPFQSLVDDGQGGATLPTVAPDNDDAPDMTPLMVPVLGHAAGSIVDRRRAGAAPVALVRCPPALEDLPGVYARRVSGSSMADRWRDGDVIFACETMEPAPGQFAILEVVAGAPDNPAEILFKQFIGRSGGAVATRQLNGGAVINLKANTVRAMHRVFEINELFGL